MVRKSPVGLADSLAPSEVNPVLSACFSLGWRVGGLFRRFEVSGDLPPGYDLPDLPGLSGLTPYEWQMLGLDQVDFVISQVTAEAGAPATVALDLTADARRELEVMIKDADETASFREEYRTALSQMHVSLLITLTAAGSSYGKAYGLGRALADTTCPQQTADQLVSSFGRDRIDQLCNWLDELASLLPEHSARAVARSLNWWQQAVEAAHAGDKLTVRTMPASHLNDQASRRPPWRQVLEALSARRHRTQETQADPPGLGEPGGRRGPPGGAVAGHARRGQAMHRFPQPAGLSACRGKACPLQRRPGRAGTDHALASHPAARFSRRPRCAAGNSWFSSRADRDRRVAAFAGTHSGIWKAIRARVIPIAMQLEKPLWGGELDTATAEAVTISPVRNQPPSTRRPKRTRQQHCRSKPMRSVTSRQRHMAGTRNCRSRRLLSQISPQIVSNADRRRRPSC